MRSTRRQRTILLLPSLKTRIGADLCTSALDLAKTGGWDETLVHDKKHNGLMLITLCFLDGGVLCCYKMCNAINVRRKFKEAETHTRSLFERRGDQNDETGGGDEGNIPSHVNLFFEFFTFVEERSSSLASARAQWWRNIRVNRSVIG